MGYNVDKTRFKKKKSIKVMTCHDIAMHWFPVKSSTFYSSKSSQHFIFIWDFHLQDTCVSISNIIKYCNLLNTVLKLLLLQFVYANKKVVLGVMSCVCIPKREDII